ncbi:hypothetical protein GOPIP_072_00350 [Gordonia polyisoprenivorans NBRC 16320 = JCM 10675]|nr:hypothetical protein GOPIP_072_00350 [Gordonia polyisoprenivorans NBRC 16320 = JCM 10675]
MSLRSSLFVSPDAGARRRGEWVYADSALPYADSARLDADSAAPYADSAHLDGDGALPCADSALPYVGSACRPDGVARYAVPVHAIRPRRMPGPNESLVSYPTRCCSQVTSAP